MKTLLLIIDPQVDFISGSLPVPGAVEAMNSLSEEIKQNPEKFSDIIVTLDSHLPGHISFKSSWEKPEDAPEGLDLWPDHCVVGTEGHSIYKPLLEALGVYKEKTNHPHQVILKGNDPKNEMYSAIGSVVSGYDGGLAYTPEINNILLGQYDIIYVAGIARDFCVAATVDDLLRCFSSQTWGKLRLLKDYMPYIITEEPSVFREAIETGKAIYE
jgi:nicotinamidase/pyrazinamidase